MQVKFINDDDFIKYKFKTKPFKHQYDVFLKSKDREAYALFMEQGTGKSKVIIDNIAYLYREGKINCAIIAAPKGVYRNWVASEFKTHMPDDVKAFTDICIWNPAETKSNIETLTNFLNPSHKLKFFIINIEALSTDKGKNYLTRLLNTSNCLWTIDESSHRKNRGSDSEGVIPDAITIEYRFPSGENACRSMSISFDRGLSCGHLWHHLRACRVDMDNVKLLVGTQVINEYMKIELLTSVREQLQATPGVLRITVVRLL